jgi:LAO/AO transport system kinase
MNEDSLKTHLSQLKQGNRDILGKLLTQAPYINDKQIELLWESFNSIKTIPKILGLLGNPGAGKSTFINQVLTLSNKFKPNTKIALLLIDPSNPYHGGSILGDRVRLSEHFLNPNFYIRSISNSSNSNGLSPHLEKYLMIMSHYQFDLIIIESVGSGQANLDLKDFSHHTTLIFDPHAGDSIQHLKEGVLTCVDQVIISKTEDISPKQISESIKEWSNQEDTWSLPINKDQLNLLLDPSGIASESLKARLYKHLLLGKIFHNVSMLAEDYFNQGSLADKNARAFSAFISKNLQKY